MTIAALIIIFAAAAVAAALGFGAAFAAQRFWRPVYPLYWFAVAGGIVGAVSSAFVISGAPSSWFGGGSQIAVADVVPYMQTIKQREPALYERIETSIIRDQDDGLSNERVRANARALVASYVADKSVFLPDNLTYELSATTRDALENLAEHENWNTCAHLALGHVDSDIDSKLGADLVERNVNNTVRVITAKRLESAPDTPAEEVAPGTPARDFAQFMPAEEFAQFAANAFAEASQITGVAPEEVDTLLAGGGDPVKTCKVMKAFFDAVLAHPVPVAAAALRTLASGERRANAI